MPSRSFARTNPTETELILEAGEGDVLEDGTISELVLKLPGPSVTIRRHIPVSARTRQLVRN